MQSVIAELEQLFEECRNVNRAATAAAYMKDHFKFYGMRAEARRSVQKKWVDSLKGIDDNATRWEIIRALWNQEERDFHYVAIDWLNSWPKKHYSKEDAEELHYLISTKSWWDSVDAIASNYLGTWAKRYPKEARITFEKWRYSDNIWLQRSCLIYQLKYKAEVDVAYLEELIVQLLPNKEFFIQKAIGWTLRQLSKFDPIAVETILSKHPIKGLAYREASKYL